jgi:hypothetical protein
MVYPPAIAESGTRRPNVLQIIESCLPTIITCTLVPTDLSQQAKSAAAEGLTDSDSIDKKVQIFFYA